MAVVVVAGMRRVRMSFGLVTREVAVGDRLGIGYIGYHMPHK